MKPSRYHYLWAIVYLLSIGCQDEQTAHNEDRPNSPNIVLIMADDQGWGDLSSNGNPNLNTPNIDAMARNGVSFENFFVQPVCSPTRAEMLTGRHFPRLGVYETSAGGERMNLGETTLADILKKSGIQNRGLRQVAQWHAAPVPSQCQGI